jgi:hypothetical protein
MEETFKQHKQKAAAMCGSNLHIKELAMYNWAYCNSGWNLELQKLLSPNPARQDSRGALGVGNGPAVHAVSCQPAENFAKICFCDNL